MEYTKTRDVTGLIYDDEQAFFRAQKVTLKHMHDRKRQNRKPSPRALGVGLRAGLAKTLKDYGLTTRGVRWTDVARDQLAYYEDRIAQGMDPSIVIKGWQS